MSGRLLYVVGPSGVGKDALLGYAGKRLPPGAKVRFARRWITRPADAGGEDHRPVSPAEFEQMRAAGRFAMAWQANGHAYGIDTEVRAWLDEGYTVVVSGSREYLGQALRDFPRLQVISITASPGLLHGRLERRARELPVEIERRLRRATEFKLPQNVAAEEIRNDEAPEIAGEALLKTILGGPAP